MPIVHAKTPDAIEEERRLLYVAVTRARQHLYPSWSSARTPASEMDTAASRRGSGRGSSMASAWAGGEGEWGGGRGHG